MSKSESKNESKEVSKPTSQKQTVIISVLATVLGCVVIFLVIAFATGMIGFNNNGQGNNMAGGGTSGGDTSIDGSSSGRHGNSGGSMDNGGQLIDNPNPKVEVKTGNKVSVGNLEFYLPKHFEMGSQAGGRDESETVYNLVNDNGWADVRIYVEKTNKEARDYLLSKNPRFEIDQDAWVINGWSWSTASAAKGGIQAWATDYGEDYVYAIILTVKLDSDQSNEAAMMIPKTLYFTKIYK